MFLVISAFWVGLTLQHTTLGAYDVISKNSFSKCFTAKAMLYPSITKIFN